MTDEELAAIEARLCALRAAGVLAPPWTAWREEIAMTDGGVIEGQHVSTATGEDVVIFEDEQGSERVPHHGAITAFIGEAPADIAALVAEVRRLRAEAIVKGEAP